MKFNIFEDLLTRPFIVYAEFEASLVKIHRTDGKTHMHVPNSSAIQFVYTHDEDRNEYHQFTGADCVIQLIPKLQELAERCVAEMRMNQEMTISREDQKQFKDATSCYLCNGCWTPGDFKVRDHDHRTGQYRGAAHTKCNILYYSNRYLPVFFHNLKGYDSHHILRAAIDIVDKDGKTRNH